jgi:hypothetical protein
MRVFLTIALRHRAAGTAPAAEKIGNFCETFRPFG